MKLFFIFLHLLVPWQGYSATTLKIDRNGFSAVEWVDQKRSLTDFEEALKYFPQKVSSDTDFEILQQELMGNDGGGGHACKLQAELYLSYVGSAINNDEQLREKFPEWRRLQTLTNPKINPGFEIIITNRPIHCRNTANALACSYPSENKMKIFCGAGGWNDLSWNEKYAHVIHEAYWWSEIDDANYFYSNKLTMNLISKDYISKEELAEPDKEISNELNEVELNNLIYLIEEDMEYPLLYVHPNSRKYVCEIFFSHSRTIILKSKGFKRKFKYKYVVQNRDVITGNKKFIFSHTQRVRKERFKGQQQKEELVVSFYSNGINIEKAEYRILISEETEKGFKSSPRTDIVFHNKYGSSNHRKGNRFCVEPNPPYRE